MDKLLSYQNWESIPGMPQWEMAEFMYRASSWREARKFVSLRKEITSSITDRLFEVKDYNYFCYVTNICDSPLAIHSLYETAEQVKIGLKQ